MNKKKFAESLSRFSSDLREIRDIRYCEECGSAYEKSYMQKIRVEYESSNGKDFYDIYYCNKHKKEYSFIKEFADGSKEYFKKN